MEFRWIDWNLDKIALHGVSQGEAEWVVNHAVQPYPQYRGNDKWLVWGSTANGLLLQVVYLVDPDGTLFVIHVRPLTNNEKHRWRKRMRGRTQR